MVPNKITHLLAGTYDEAPDKISKIRRIKGYRKAEMSLCEG